MVAQWLTERGQGQFAVGICKAFRDAQYPPTEWLATLKEMPPDALNDLLAAVAATATPSPAPAPAPAQDPAPAPAPAPVSATAFNRTVGDATVGQSAQNNAAAAEVAAAATDALPNLYVLDTATLCMEHFSSLLYDACVFACVCSRRTPAEQGVQQFLAGKGYAQYARHICKAFAGAQYPEAEWVAALQQMPESSLVELVAAAQRATGA